MENESTIEFGFLVDLVFEPERARHYAEKYGLGEAAFREPGHGAAFAELFAETSNDQLVLYNVLKRHMPSVPEIGKLGECIAFSDDYIANRACLLSTACYRNGIVDAVRYAMANPKLVNADTIEQVAHDAVTSVAKPYCGGSECDQPDESDVGDSAMPAELLHVPGFVDQLAAYTLKCSRRPNRPLAFAGALAMLSHLAGRLFRTVDNTCPNLYFMAIADTGVGKEAPRRTNKDLAAKVEISGSVFDQIASGEALEDALFRYPAALVQMDEIQTTLQAAKDGKNTVAQGIYRYLLSLYSESGTTHSMRLKSDSRARTDVTSDRVIHDPHLTLFGTGVPRGFYQSLSLDALENGLAGRCLVVEGDPREPLSKMSAKPELPPDVVRVAQEFASRRLRRPWIGKTDPQIVPIDDDAFNEIFRTSEETDALCDQAEAQSDLPGKALWARASEKVQKLALLHALSANPMLPKVTVDGVRWAHDFVFHCTKRMCKLAGIYITSGVVDENCRRILQLFGGKRKIALTRSEIMKKLHLDAKAISDAEQTLIMRDEIEVVQVSKCRVQYRRKNTK